MILLPLFTLGTALCLLPMLAGGGTGALNLFTLTERLSPAAGHAAMRADMLAVLCLAIFVLAYAVVLTEERHHMRKAIPVMFAAAIIWAVIAVMAPGYGIGHEDIEASFSKGLHEYAALFLFLLSAMTFIATLAERRVFDALRSRLVHAGLNSRQMFAATGALAFCLSPIADNLTTALVLGAVVMALGKHSPKFVALCCVNVVNAANAGGAFSPFGDITTLMVWQAGKLGFFEFFRLFLPSLICFLVPMALMYPFVPKESQGSKGETVHMKRGARFIIGLGLMTIAMAVLFEQALRLPSYLGMIAGLSLLMLTAYILQHTGQKGEDEDFDIIEIMKGVEWDTLLFFFGVIFSVGGLAFLGYLEWASQAMFEGWGPTAAGVVLGIVSALVDNIPVMFAVLNMDPAMGHEQWLLITLTAGVGGSLLSIGSAAGVALMGVAHRRYTFLSHLKWTPFLALGYAAAVGTHIWINM